jgi:hypothetical protein
MPIDPIKITEFGGMNNTKERSQTPNEPHVILNAIVGNDKNVEKRPGYTRKMILINAHSGWSDGDFIIFVGESPDPVTQTESVSFQESVDAEVL